MAWFIDANGGGDFAKEWILFWADLASFFPPQHCAFLFLPSWFVGGFGVDHLLEINSCDGSDGF